MMPKMPPGPDHTRTDLRLFHDIHVIVGQVFSKQMPKKFASALMEHYIGKCVTYFSNPDSQTSWWTAKKPSLAAYSADIGAGSACTICCQSSPLCAILLLSLLATHPERSITCPLLTSCAVISYIFILYIYMWQMTDWLLETTTRSANTNTHAHQWH